MLTKDNRQSIGKRICSVRLTSGLTQGHFASFVGVPRQAVTDYEQGGDVPFEVMVAIGKTFQVNWVWLLTGIGPRGSCTFILRISLQPENQVVYHGVWPCQLIADNA